MRQTLFALWQDGPSEFEEVEKELGSKVAKSASKGNINGDGEPKEKSGVYMLRRLFSPVFLEAFVLTFLAEWGDRSQVILPSPKHIQCPELSRQVDGCMLKVAWSAMTSYNTSGECGPHLASVAASAW